MRKPFIAGNWKMNGTLESASLLIKGLQSQFNDYQSSDVVVFPSYIYLTPIANTLKNSSIHMGAQNLSQYDRGAYTGEISGNMLKDIGCEYVLIGHSERRSLFHESNELIAKKFEAAQKADLLPVLCVGETIQEHKEGLTHRVVLNQIDTVINHVGIGAFKNAVIAYEPIWAIGTGITATPEHVQVVHAYIRSLIDAKDAVISDSVRIVYGGSVKPANASQLFAMPDIDGALVGGASLNLDEFANIIRAA